VDAEVEEEAAVGAAVAVTVEEAVVGGVAVVAVAVADS